MFHRTLASYSTDAGLSFSHNFLFGNSDVCAQPPTSGLTWSRTGYMNHSVLYIVENGFDIYHGTFSRYSDFKEYLSDYHKNLYEHVIKYLPV